MIKYVLLLLILPSVLSGQSADSLLLVLKKNTLADTSRVNTLNSLAYQYWLNGEDSLARLRSHEAIRLAKKAGFATGEAHARFQLVRIEMDRLEDVGGAYAHLDTADQLARRINDPILQGISTFRRGQMITVADMDAPDQVDSLFDVSLALFKKSGAKYWESQVYGEQASLMGWDGQYAQAIDLMLKARALQESLGDEKALRATLPNLGVTYAKVEMYREALECFEKAEKIATKNNDIRIVAFVQNQKGDIYKKQHKLPEAIKAYQSAAAVFEKTGTSQFLPSAYARLSDLYFTLGQLEESMRYNQKADSVFRQSNTREAIYHYVQINYGNLYGQLKNYPKVISIASEGLKSINDIGTMLFEESSYHKQLAEAYRHQGNYKLAYEHLSAFITASDSLFNDESRQKIQAATMTYEFDKMKAGKDLEIQQLENARLLQTRNILIFAFLAGLALVAYILWVNRRLRRYNAQLIHKNREIEMALDRGQKIERRRVASELHDNLNTKLAALRWSLESMNTQQWDTPNRTLHKKIMAMAADAYKDVRLISHNMLPAELEAEGLPAAFRQLALKLNELGDIRFRFTEQNMDRRLSKNEEHQLYNIALEAINNVLKHAQANRVDIAISIQNRVLELQISDNGKGMEKGQAQNGMGMHNISNRAESIGAAVRVETAPGEGTRLVVNMPLPLI